MTDPDALVAFLRARIAEKRARAASGYPDGWHSIRCGHDQIEFSETCDCGVPATVLREADALLRVLDLNEYAHDDHVHRYTLRLLALPHAEHPDYRAEWAPDA